MAIDREDSLKRAEKLLRQGRLDAAIAEYERVVEAYPYDWNVANTLGDLFLRAHRAEKAVEQYCRIADHSLQEGFLPKASALYRKALRLVPAHEHALQQSATIAIRQGLLAEARQFLSTLAAARAARGDEAGAAEARMRIGTLDPGDADARVAAVESLGPADAPAETAELQAVADAFEARGEGARAVAVLEELFRRHPRDRVLGTRLVRAHLGSGDHDAALAIAEAVGDIDDGDLLFWLGTERATRGQGDAARAAFARVLAREPHRCEAMIAHAEGLAEEEPEAALVYLEPAADVHILRGEFEAAAAAYRQFVDRQPNHIRALQRLVEICLDGHLEAGLTSAQAMLVDAYLISGRGDEARVVAEDVVKRHPDGPDHVERLRQALRQAGEPDVEAAIAERVKTGGRAGGDELGAAASTVSPVVPAEQPDPFRLGPIAIDLHDILGDELDEPTAQGREAGEIDLSAALDRLSAEATAPDGSAPPAPVPNLEEVFKEFRDEVSRDSDDEAAERHFRLGLTYRDMGMVPQATRELEIAARSPRLRFEAASLLGRLLNTLGQTREAVEWFERAAEAPAPSVEEGRALLYDLAAALEIHGETGRALAVFLELKADAGDFRDVTRRIHRLSRPSSGG